ncbi:MAG: hypothetical protein FWG43_05720, partial [Clostridiales bacterium]|nr:hypothetical protein [Clostridiales bacterium]
VTKPGYLKYIIKNFHFNDGDQLPPLDISQLAGDINGDGVVNAEDLTCLVFVSQSLRHALRLSSKSKILA